MNSLTMKPVLAIILLIVVARECESVAKLSARIVGGVVKDISLRPFQVALEITRGSKQHLCGGSLLKLKTVLTAAHCVL